MLVCMCARVQVYLTGMCDLVIVARFPLVLSRTLSVMCALFLSLFCLSFLFLSFFYPVSFYQPPIESQLSMLKHALVGCMYGSVCYTSCARWLADLYWRSVGPAQLAKEQCVSLSLPDGDGHVWDRLSVPFAICSIPISVTSTPTN